MTDEKELTIKAARILELAEQCPEWKKGLETLFPEAFEEEELPVPEITDGNGEPVAGSEVSIYRSGYRSDYNFRGWAGTNGHMCINLCPTSEKRNSCYCYNDWPVININKYHARDLANTILEILGENK